MLNKILLALSSIVAVASDMSLVWWAKHEQHPVLFLVIGIVTMNIAVLIWLYTLWHGIESASAIIFYALFTAAGCSLLGILFFNETLSVVNIIGLTLGIIALILISLA